MIAGNYVSCGINVPKKIESKDKYEFGIYGRTPLAYGIKDYPYQKIKEMGIDNVYVHFTNVDGIEHALKTAKEAGVKVWFDGYWDLLSKGKVVKNKWDVIDNYPESFGGSFVVDEPYLFGKGEKDNYKLLENSDALAKELVMAYPQGKHVITALGNYATVGQLTTGVAKDNYKKPTEDQYTDYVRRVADSRTDVVMAGHYGYGTEGLEETWPMQMHVLRKISNETKKPIWVWSLISKHLGYKEYDQKDVLYTIEWNMMWGVESVWFYLYGDYSYNGGKMKYTNSPFKGEEVTKTGVWLGELLNGVCKGYGSLFKGAEMKSVDIWEGADKNEHPKGVKKIEGQVLVNNFKKDGHEYVGVMALKDSLVGMYPAYRYVVESDLSITRGKLKLKNEFKMEKGDMKIFFVR